MQHRQVATRHRSTLRLLVSGVDMPASVGNAASAVMACPYIETSSHENEVAITRAPRSRR